MRNREERTELIRAVSQGGETVRAAAMRLGVPISTAQRWVRNVTAAPSPPAKTRFVEAIVDRVVTPTIRVRVGVAELEVRAGFDARLLREVAAALGGDA
jgi:transposase-like protein